MATLDHIKSVTSTSQNSVSMVVLEFENGTDMNTLSIDMQQKLTALQGEWDEMVSTPYMLKINPSMLPVMVAAISYEGKDVEELSDFVAEELERKLTGISGVASVDISGTLERQMHVILDEKKLDKVSAEMLVEAEKLLDDADKTLKDARKQVVEAQEKIADAKEDMADSAAGEISGAAGSASDMLDSLQNFNPDDPDDLPQITKKELQVPQKKDYKTDAEYKQALINQGNFLTAYISANKEATLTLKSELATVRREIIDLGGQVSGDYSEIHAAPSRPDLPSFSSPTDVPSSGTGTGGSTPDDSTGYDDLTDAEKLEVQKNREAEIVKQLKNYAELLSVAEESLDEIEKILAAEPYKTTLEKEK